MRSDSLPYDGRAKDKPKTPDMVSDHIIDSAASMVYYSIKGKINFFPASRFLLCFSVC